MGYKIRPSSLARVMACTASPSLIAQYPAIEDETSPAAHEGTVCHSLCAIDLLTGVSVKSYLGKVVDGIEITLDLVKAMQVYVAYVNLNVGKGTLYLEERVALDAELGGTADAIIVSEDKKEIHVIDLKMGAGIWVDVEDNPQLTFYGVAAAKQLCKKYEKIKTTIVQPRCHRRKGDLIRSAEYTRAQGQAFIRRLRKSVDTVNGPKATFAVGKHCRFCLVLPVCEEHKKLASGAIALPPDAAGVDLINSLDMLDSLTMWMKAVKKHALAELKKGANLGTWCLVDKRAMRKWKDDDLVLKTVEDLGSFLGIEPDSMVEKTVLSVAQLEAKIGELPSELSCLVEAKSSGKTLGKAKENDAVALLDSQLAAFIKS